MASDGEGFSLPILEAAHHDLPIIARDIPVFRELAGAHAHYFSGLSPSSLAGAVQAWLELDRRGAAPRSNSMPGLTWNESTRQLLDGVIGDQSYRSWTPSTIRRFWGSDPRLQTQVGRRVGRDTVSTGLAGCLTHGPYITLDPGTYRILVNGTLGDGDKVGATMDVAVEKAARILARTPVHKPEADGTIASLQICLAETATDLEIRIFVDNGAEVTISSLEIQPILKAKSTLASGDNMRADIPSNAAVNS
jgi:hypothetical protein